MLIFFREPITGQLTNHNPKDIMKQTPPHIGQHWPEQNGIYCGIARGFDGEPDGHLVLLDDKPETKLNWQDAMAWAANLGDGARLPNRFEASFVGAQIHDKIDQPYYYWSASEYSATGAWAQYWASGNPGGQNRPNKANAYYVRAVRRLIL